MFPDFVVGTPVATATNATTVSLAQPTGAVAGDRAVFIIGMDEAPSIPAVTGWTPTVQANSTLCELIVLWRNLDGSESWPITFTIATNMYSYVPARWPAGTFDPLQAPDILTATGTSTTATPPSNTAAWGVADNHFLAGAIFNGGNRTVSDTAPTNYTPLATAGASGNTNSTITIVADRDLYSDIDTPDTVAISVSDAWVSFLIITKPLYQAFVRGFNIDIEVGLSGGKLKHIRIVDTGSAYSFLAIADVTSPPGAFLTGWSHAGTPVTLLDIYSPEINDTNITMTLGT